MKVSDGLSMGDAAAPAGPADEAAILEELFSCAQHFDDAVNDTLHDGANAEPPDADDYNQLMGYIGQARRKLAELRGWRAGPAGGRRLSGPADWCARFDALQNELPGGAGSLTAVREAEARTWHLLYTGEALNLMGTPEAGEALRAHAALARELRGAGLGHDRDLAIAAARGQLLLAKIALRKSLAAAFPPAGRPRWESDDREWRAMAEAAEASP